MSSIKLNPYELEALQELTWAGYPFAALMYVLQLRMRMNFDTFMVGDRPESTVSERWLIDSLERHAKPGSHNGPKKRDRSFIQRQLSALVDFGLVDRKTKKKVSDPMLLFFPLAACESFRPQEERTRSEQGQTNNVLMFGANKPNADDTGPCVVRSEQQNSGGANKEKTPRSEPIPVNRYISSNNLISSPVETQIVNGVAYGDGFAIPKDWEPSDEAIMSLHEGHTCNPDRLNWHINLWRFYWIERGESRPDWNKVFVEYTNAYGLKR